LTEQAEQIEDEKNAADAELEALGEQKKRIE
jgi:hypothetical protein